MRGWMFWVGTLVIVTAITIHTVRIHRMSSSASDPLRDPAEQVLQSGRPPSGLQAAEAHAAALPETERRAAEKELAEASAELFRARSTAPVRREQILDVQVRQDAAEHRWRVAMARLYGPTWEAHHGRALAEAEQAVDGMASRLGYPQN